MMLNVNDFIQNLGRKSIERNFARIPQNYMKDIL